jgi:20S proteasome subunit alpha 2
MADAAYSFSLTTFSRTGKLLPLEYALNAVANGRTTLAIATQHGVVLATDQKMPSPLVDASQVSKIATIHETAGMCFAGVGPDYRVLGTLCCIVHNTLRNQKCFCVSLYVRS